MSEKEPKLPFVGSLLDMELPHRNFEARIKELEDQGFVVKEIKIEHENLLEAARERYKRSLELLQENGFGEFLPETFVLIGEGSEGKPAIYIVQEKIEGKHYDDIINADTAPKLLEYYRRQVEVYSSSTEEGKKPRPDFEEYPCRDVLEQADALALKSLQLWEKTLNLPPEEKKDLPIATAFGRETRRPKGNEGLMPEIMNPINMIYGRRPGKDETDRLFLIDVGLVAPDENLIFDTRLPNGHINDVQDNLERFLPTSLLALVKKKLMRAGEDLKAYKEFEKIFPGESGELYKQLQRKYSRHEESDDGV